MNQIFSLDVETAATSPDWQYSSLEPWRVRQDKSFITAISVCDSEGDTDTLLRSNYDSKESYIEAIISMLTNLEGQIVYCHNAVFDVAFLIASIQPARCGLIPKCIRKIRWRDSMLLTKWVINGQRAEAINFSYSLVNLAQNFLDTHERLAEFVEMKSKPFDPNDQQYWNERNVLDVIMTQALAVFMESHLHESQRNGYVTEMRNIIPVANAWITGIRINKPKLPEVRDKFQLEMNEILAKTGLSGSMITSPKQLGDFLFVQLAIKPKSFTPKGAPRTAADDIKLIAYEANLSGDQKMADTLNGIKRYKELSTLMSKYISGIEKALAHTGDGYIYGAPRIFGTYTGRFTYSSKTLDTYQTSLALHQIPRRDKEIRSLLIAPEGMRLYEADASGQESRLMAIRSGDPLMIKVFNENMDLHAMTGANIVGIEYDDLIKGYKSGDPRSTEIRQNGKLTNLSCNYRIGGKALSKKAFEDYDVLFSIDTGIFIVNAFARSYAGIPLYWTSAIAFTRNSGYAETFGGRRYKINDWSSKWRWSSESSAIMVPIQGSGASMKNIAISETDEKVPEAVFILDLHDATFYYVPDDSYKAKIDSVLENIDYEKYWGFKPAIRLPYDSKIGDSWADVK